eukprot:SRR837773.8723.p2 GENE.SRR837773.8723~~SRR837773.8723.p2  ORF type:complete len:656 (+),score=337.99 SRR837773.8723:42-1970(+)
MKLCAVALLALGAQGAQLRRQEDLERNPMAKVAQLLSGMTSRIESDGMSEQQSYDKYACWCEDTLARKATDISKAKSLIEDLQAQILKLNGETGAHGAEIKALEQDIQDNLKAQEEAKGVRDNEFEDYNKKRTEGEQCAGALEAAVKALAGAGTGKFLQASLREAQLLSVVAGVRRVLEQPAAARRLSSEDVAAVRRFVEQPENYGSGVSNLQTGNNPFGDYAPQSTQIQGILKGMYDTFVGDMEKSNAEEAESQKAFEELMATKQRELETLQATLEQTKGDDARKTSSLAESEELQDATKEQLAADETFFEETKQGCQVKAEEWNVRSRLRTMELQGVTKAIEILTSPEAQKTFTAATNTFVQLAASTRRSLTSRGSGLAQKLSGLARRYHSFAMLQVAAALRSGGHFDKVIASIDAMVEDLRREEQEDIEHRDRCQNADAKNKNDMEDLNAAIDKATKGIARLSTTEERLGDEIEVLDAQIAKTRAEMRDALDMRNNDVAEFKQSLKDDADAIKLLEQATAAVRQFYEKNGIPLSLVSKGVQPDTEYTVDPDKAPETSWSGPDYGGRKEETTGIVAMLDMLKEDLEKEMSTARADDAEAQKLYEEQRGAMQESLDATLGTKVAPRRSSRRPSPRRPPWRS